MRRGVILATLAVLTIASGLAIASPALADSASPTRILPTTDHITAALGSSVEVRFSLGSVSADAPFYSVYVKSLDDPDNVEKQEVECGFESGQISPGQELTCTFEVNADPDCACMVFTAGEYAVEVIHVHESSLWEDQLFTMTVVGSPHAISVSASPLVFYPLVRDGYRDTTRFSFSFDRPAQIITQVKNKNGRIIRQIGLGTLQSGSWRWNGRNNAGNKVDPGYYWLRARATANGLTAGTAWIRVRVKTALVTRQATKGRAGNDFSTRATSGACYVFIDNYFGTANPDCFGGNYALVRYRFAIPSSAYNISWRVRGVVSGDDICCFGSISKFGTRTSSRSFVLTAKVTGYRSYEVEAARVSYSYKKRI